MGDTANKVGTVGECLYSIGNRVEIAKILYELRKGELLKTELEDIWRTVQDMGDEHCVVRK